MRKIRAFVNGVLIGLAAGLVIGLAVTADAAPSLPRRGQVITHTGSRVWIPQNGCRLLSRADSMKYVESWVCGRTSYSRSR